MCFVLTVKDHGKLVALDRYTLLAHEVEVECVLDHGFFFLLLVRHESVLLRHVAVIVSGTFRTTIRQKSVRLEHPFSTISTSLDFSKTREID